MTAPVDPPAKPATEKSKAPRRRTPPVLSVVPSAAEPVAELAAATRKSVVKSARAAVDVAETAAETAIAALPDPLPVFEAPAPAFVEPPSILLAPTPLPSSPVKVNPMTTSFAGYEDMTAIGKANLDALIQANSAFTKGIEELSKEFMSLTKASLESAAAASTAMLSAKSLKDVVALNADFTKTHYESLIANSTKLGELTVKVASESVAPIKARFESALDKVKSATV